MNLLHQWSLGELQDKQHPRRLIVTPEPNCNLACEHCYFAHGKVTPSESDWSSGIQFALDHNMSVLCAGRIVTGRVVDFVRTYLSITSDQSKPSRLSAIDNGYTIFNLQPFFGQIGTFNISIDGNDASHDRQRNKKGSARKAWEAVGELQQQGFDPILSSCMSPLTVEGWEEFEREVEQKDVRLSVSLCLEIDHTRSTSLFTSSLDRACALEKLVTGIPKLVQIYDLKDIPPLMEVLGTVAWKPDSSLPGMVTTLTNGVKIIYRPLSLSYLTEFFMDHTGKILSHTRSNTIQELNQKELLIWNQ